MLPMPRLVVKSSASDPENPSETPYIVVDEDGRRYGDVYDTNAHGSHVPLPSEVAREGVAADAPLYVTLEDEATIRSALGGG